MPDPLASTTSPAVVEQSTLSVNETDRNKSSLESKMVQKETTYGNDETITVS